MAIVTALLAATIACNSDDNQHMMSTGSTAHASNRSAATVNGPVAAMTAALTALSPSPSLVGLAINYTLLMPIYLNWVVKLLADMEMYVGSVERIAYYAETQSDDKSKREQNGTHDKNTITTSTTNNNNQICCSKVSEVQASASSHPTTPSISQPQLDEDNVGRRRSKRTMASMSAEPKKVCSNDKLLTANEKSDTRAARMATAPGEMTTSLFTTDNNVDETVVVAPKTAITNSSIAIAPADDDRNGDDDDDNVMKNMKLKQQDKTNEATTSTTAADNIAHHHRRRHITNDGHIAVTTKTLSHQQTEDVEQDNDTAPTALLLAKEGTPPPASSALSVMRQTQAQQQQPETSNDILTNSTTTSLKLLERNDAERRASVRRLGKNKKQCKYYQRTDRPDTEV